MDVKLSRKIGQEAAREDFFIYIVRVSFNW